MTNEEAIEMLKEDILEHPYDEITSIHILDEAVTVAIKALEKQIPKKPVKHPTLKDTLNWLCPTCSRLYWKPNYNYLNDYCGSCGQKLDWED